MNNQKTNNSYLKKKIVLRLLNLPDKNEIKVLDCFAGNGIIWHNIKLNINKKIIRHAIDEKEYESFAMIGDNLKILAALDLSIYDVIDLDAYGVPCEQIEIVMNKARPGAIIFYTFIQSFNGALPNKLFERIGITESMYSKCRAIFNKGGNKYFLNFLACNNIKTVVYFNHGRKFYGMFKKEK
jgi:mRNA-degrading endonuclease HigB of HigAB toxin-antitoxin module